MKRFLTALLLFVSSASAESMKVHVNLNHLAGAHFTAAPENILFDTLVTDAFVIISGENAVSIQDAPKVYADFRNQILTLNPNINLGSYVSSRMVRSRELLRFYPDEAHDPKYFSPSELMKSPYAPVVEPGDFVDYSQPQAQAKLIKLIVKVAIERKLKIIYLDNWIHDHNYSGQFIKWKTTIKFMGTLRRQLNAIDVKMYCNIAIAPGSCPEEDFKLLAANCDGMSTEMPLLPQNGSNPNLLNLVVKSYAHLKAKNVQTILIAVGPETDIEFIAAFAALLDHPVVSYPFWKPNPDWQFLRDKLGPATSGITQSDTRLVRYFENGNIKLDCLTRTPTITFK